MKCVNYFVGCRRALVLEHDVVCVYMACLELI